MWMFSEWLKKKKKEKILIQVLKVERYDIITVYTEVILEFLS